MLISTMYLRAPFRHRFYYAHPRFRVVEGELLCGLSMG